MRTYYIVLILIIFSACSKDKGNYAYTELNDVVISDIKTGSANDDVYNVVFGRNLVITPTINRKLKPDDDLSFVWEIGKDTVAKTKNIDVPIQKTFGRSKGRFTVIDNKNGMKYFADFAINVTSPYGKGYFVLAEKADGTTMLSFKSLINPEDPIVTSEDISGVRYGSKPVNIMGFKLYASGPNDYKWQVFITSQEGPNPTIFTDLTSFLPQQLINGSSFLGGEGPAFKPSFAKSFASNTVKFFISEGKLITFHSGLLYRPAAPNDPDDYRLAPWIGTVTSVHQSFFTGYDEKNERFRLFTPMPADVIGGVVGDRYTYDRIIEIPGWQEATKGQHFFAGGSWYASAIKAATCKAILKDNNNLHFYTIAYNLNISPLPSYVIPVITKDATVPIPANLSANSVGLLSEITFDWFIGAGNKIYRTNSLTPAPEELITLPANAGEVTAMKFIAGDTKLLITTYNSGAAAANKGSMYIIDIAGKNILESYENITGKPKDIFVAD